MCFDEYDRLTDWPYGDEDDSDEEEDFDDDDGWGCEFGERCLMPGYDHRRSECYTVEMALEWEKEYKK